MKKIVLSVLYYLAIILLILEIHTWSPTSLAGPGLDIVVYFISPIVSAALLAVSLKKLQPANKLSYISCFINILGTGLVVFFLCHV
jgi:hypothetical protein